MVGDCRRDAAGCAEWRYRAEHAEAAAERLREALVIVEEELEVARSDAAACRACLRDVLDAERAEIERLRQVASAAQNLVKCWDLEGNGVGVRAAEDGLIRAVRLMAKGGE